MRPLILALGLMACAKPVAPAPPMLAPTDAAQDAALPDAAEPDTSVRDAGTDTGADTGPDAPESPDARRIEPSPISDPCADVAASTCGICPAGYMCADSVCAGEACQPGRACVDDTDCGGTVCVRNEDEPAGRCEPSLGTCSSDASCPHGFHCEAGSCVDRRVACAGGMTNCPRGFMCTFAAVMEIPFCVEAMIPCERRVQCELGADCIDVNGDGETECVPAGLCASHDDCPGGLSCGVDPSTGQAACVSDGPCLETGCPAGYECRSAGLGIPQCVPAGGSCAFHTDCPAGAVCAALREGDPLHCISAMGPS